MKIKTLFLITITLLSVTTTSAKQLSFDLSYPDTELPVMKVRQDGTLPLSKPLYSGSENDSFFNSFNNNSNTKSECVSIEAGGSIIGALTAITISLPLSSIFEDSTRDIGRNLIIHPSISSLVLTPILTSIGASLTGKILKQKGSYPKSLCGSLIQGLILSAIGATAGIIVGTAENMIKEKQSNIFFIIAGASIGWELGTISGSVQGYNWK